MDIIDETAEIMKEMKEFANRNPDDASPEDRVKIAQARSVELLDFMKDRGWAVSGENTTSCAAALLFAAGMLADLAGLNQMEIQACFNGGLHIGALLKDIKNKPADA